VVSSLARDDSSRSFDGERSVLFAERTGGFELLPGPPTSSLISSRLVEGSVRLENLTAPDPSQVLSDFTHGRHESPPDRGLFFF